MHRHWPLAAILPVLALSACSPATGPSSGIGSNAAAVATLQRINSQAHACWLRDNAFADYGIVPELDTAGTPRLLVIPRGKPQSLPKAVIVASADSAQFYGPLSTSPLAGRMNTDISRWARGSSGC